MFFNYNANTLGFSYIIYISSKIVNLDYDLIAKLLSTSGLIFILIGIFNILNIIKIKLVNNDLFLFNINNFFKSTNI